MLSETLPEGRCAQARWPRPGHAPGPGPSRSPAPRQAGPRPLATPLDRASAVVLGRYHAPHFQSGPSSPEPKFKGHSPTFQLGLRC